MNGNEGSVEAAEAGVPTSAAAAALEQIPAAAEVDGVPPTPPLIPGAEAVVTPPSSSASEEGAPTSSQHPTSARPPTAQHHGTHVAELKATLIAMLAGLDRGLSAGADDASRVDALAAQLEAAGGGVVLSWTKQGELRRSQGGC